MLAAVVEGKADLADVLFLVAFILFVIGAFLAAAVQPVALWTVLLFAGLAAAAAGWFVL